MSNIGWLERLTGDLRFLKQVVRSLAKTPLFACAAVFTLAVGIGANAAIFTVVEGVLLKPLPYPHADQLLVLDHAAPGLNIPHAGFAASPGPTLR